TPKPDAGRPIKKHSLGESMKTRLRSICSLAVLSSALVVGCGGGSGQESSPNPIIGPVSFSQNVQPIFNQTCAAAGCHAGASVASSGNLDLSTGVSFANLVNQPVSNGCAIQAPGVVRVNPGDTMGSMLWRKVAADPSRCFSPMPLGSAGRSHTNPNAFDTIERWIREGASNNEVRRAAAFCERCRAQ